LYPGAEAGGADGADIVGGADGATATAIAIGAEAGGADGTDIVGGADGATATAIAVGGDESAAGTATGEPTFHVPLCPASP